MTLKVNIKEKESSNKQYLVIGTRQLRNKIDIPHININGIDIAPTSTVRNLDVMFDIEMSMKTHVSSMNRSAYPPLKNLRAIKPFLDMEAANTAAHAFVLSRRKLHFVWYFTRSTSMHSKNIEYWHQDYNQYQAI